MLFWSALTSQRFVRSRLVAAMGRLNPRGARGVKPPQTKAVTGQRAPKSRHSKEGPLFQVSAHGGKEKQHGRTFAWTSRRSRSLEVWRRLRLDNPGLYYCLLATRLRAMLDSPACARAARPRSCQPAIPACHRRVGFSEPATGLSPVAAVALPRVVQLFLLP